MTRRTARSLLSPLPPAAAVHASLAWRPARRPMEARASCAPQWQQWLVGSWQAAGVAG